MTGKEIINKDVDKFETKMRSKMKAKALTKAKENIHGVRYSTPAEQKKKLASWPTASKGDNGIGRGTNDASRNTPPGHDYQPRSKYSR